MIKQPNILDIIEFMPLYYSGILCTKSVMWKPSVQMFKANLPFIVAEQHDKLMSGEYKSLGFSHFKLMERGKWRDINSVHVIERMVQKSLCINGLRPVILPRLIYENCASQVGKGTHFMLKLLKKQLLYMYHKYGKSCYIMVMDYHAYYDSISHAILLDMVNNWIDDKNVVNLFAYFLSMFSHINDPHFVKEIKAVNTVGQYFEKVNKGEISIDNIQGYEKSPETKLGVKSGLYIPNLNHSEYIVEDFVLNRDDYIEENDVYGVGLGLGSEISQLASIAYTNHIDHAVKEKFKIEAYGKYMDDSYMISNDRNHLINVFNFIQEESAKLNLTFNPKRTQIYNIKDVFYFLKKQISITDNGKVLMKLSGEAIKKHRDIMEAHRKMYENNILTFQACYESFYSWRQSNLIFDSRNSLVALTKEFYRLFREEINHYGLHNQLFTI